MKNRTTNDTISQVAFLLCSLLAALTVIFFVGTIFYIAYPTFVQQGFINFITGSTWNYDSGVYGIHTYLMGTIYLTVLTLIIAVPVSLFTAIFLSEYASRTLASVIRPFVELLVGIPSVVYGIFGLFVLAPFFNDHIDPLINANLGFISIFADINSDTGIGLLLASTVLAIMILPTIISISEDSMRTVPYSFKEASYSLGATKWETIRRVVLPTASPGILSAIVLGMMRAMGETMAIVMLLGNVGHVPNSIFDYGYAMTSKILNEIGYRVADPEPRSALFAVAAILFIIEILFVATARYIGGRK